MTISTESHAPDELLERYAMRSLSEEAAERLEDHLMFCRRCQLQLESVESFLLAARQASRQIRAEAEEKHASSFWSKLVRFRLSPIFESQKQLAIPAAGLALAICSLLVLIPDGNKPQLYQQVRLEAMRDSGSSIVAAANTPLELVLNISGLPAPNVYRVEVVSSNGSAISNNNAEAKAEYLSLRLGPELKAGQYWVRIYPANSTDPAREFSLRVQ